MTLDLVTKLFEGICCEGPSRRLLTRNLGLPFGDKEIKVWLKTPHFERGSLWPLIFLSTGPSGSLWTGPHHPCVLCRKQWPLKSVWGGRQYNLNHCSMSILTLKNPSSSICGRFLFLVIRNRTNLGAEGIKGRFLIVMEVESSTRRDDRMERENPRQEGRGLQVQVRGWKENASREQTGLSPRIGLWEASTETLGRPQETRERAPPPTTLSRFLASKMNELGCVIFHPPIVSNSVITPCVEIQGSRTHLCPR